MDARIGRPLLDPQTWIARAVGHAADHTEAADRHRLRVAALDHLRASRPEPPSVPVTEGEARQVAYLRVTTDLARLTAAPGGSSPGIDPQALADVLWRASTWLWDQLLPTDRVGACKIAPVGAPPTIPRPERREHRVRRWRRAH